MRIRIKTTSNEKILPFDYQGKLIGVIHKWLGNNELHDKISLYSFSWLLGGVMVDKKGYVFPNGAELLISFHDVNSTLAVSNIRNRTYTNCEVYLIDYGYGNFKEKIHFME